MKEKYKLTHSQLMKNRDDIEPFKQLNDKYVMLHKQYAHSFRELYSRAISKAYRQEYAKGGTTIHRGVYSPSALDFVFGGCNRGNLLKKIPKNHAFDYEYTFDEEGNLIICKKYDKVSDGQFAESYIGSIELFIYEQSKVLSLIYEPRSNDVLSFITECQYEGNKIIRYESALCALLPYGGEDCTELNAEDFEYENDVLCALSWHRYSPDLELLQQEKYAFYRDDT